MHTTRTGAFRCDLKGIATLCVVALVGGYLLFGAWHQAVRRARVRESEKGAEQAIEEARRAASIAPLPPGWTRVVRRVTLALPLENRDEEVTYWVNTAGMEFVPIPAGRFRMGQNRSPDFADAAPEHWVRIMRPLFMGAHEVTRAQYEKLTGKYVPFRAGPQRSDEPACGVTWDDAAGFCRTLSEQEGLSYRLPTEAEWEYACRAGTTTNNYMGSRDTTELCCLYYKPKAVMEKENWQPRIHPEPIGTFPANAFGLFNMAGNAWEWCQDWYAADYYARSPIDDPPGPPTGTSHVRRGGSFTTGRTGSFSYYRVSPKADPRPSGFRVVLALDAVGPAVQ